MADPNPQIISAVISAAINSVVVVVGFFIFHTLASRRQSRDECIGLSKDLLDTLAKYESEVSAAWAKDGKDAVADGHGFKAYALAIELSTMLESLRHKTRAFDACATGFSNLRRSADEIGKPGEKRYFHINDQKRTTKFSEHPEFSKQYFLLRQAIRRAVARRFK